MTAQHVLGPKKHSYLSWPHQVAYHSSSQSCQRLVVKVRHAHPWWPNTQMQKNSIHWMTYKSACASRMKVHIPVILSTRTCQRGNSCSNCLISFFWCRSEIISSKDPYNSTLGMSTFMQLISRFVIYMPVLHRDKISFAVVMEVLSCIQRGNLRGYAAQDELYSTCSFIFQFLTMLQHLISTIPVWKEKDDSKFLWAEKMKTWEQYSTMKVILL